MCGIAGLIRFDGDPVHCEPLEIMTGVLRHRGPDGVGVHLAGNIGLAMTRLAIIDVAGGQQPILNERGTMAIVCNGEIYNYSVLRSRLERNGHRFRTHSDVEVVLHLYEDLGADCFRELNGMFSAAIADFENRKLLLARDHCGQKPLYLWRTDNFLAFASELKALVELPGFSRKLSGEALTDLLAYRYISAPLSMFEGTSKLPPGSCLSIDASGHTDLHRYWQIDFGPKENPPRKAGSIRGELMAAVDRHLMSERPLGVFLSGGLDSAAIVACMHDSGHRHIRTYTVGFEGFLDNEFQNARDIAEQFKTSHEEVLLTPEEFWHSLDEMIYYGDEPMADMTSIAIYHLAKRASRDVVVVLSGEGSDELLAGYNGLERTRRDFDRLHALRKFASLGRILLRYEWPESFKRRLLAITESDAEYVARTIYSYLGYFDPQFRRTRGMDLANCGDPLKTRAAYSRRREGWHGVNLELGMMMEWSLPDDLLHRSDRMTMAHSVELRCPFLDTEFVDYCAHLKLDDKVTGKNVEPCRKIAMKKAFGEILPPGIAYQKKKGFVMPAHSKNNGWLQNIYADRARAELARTDGLAAQLFPHSVRLDIANRAIEGSVHDQYRAWSLIVLNKWADHWL